MEIAVRNAISGSLACADSRPRKICRNRIMYGDLDLQGQTNILFSQLLETSSPHLNNLLPNPACCLQSSRGSFAGIFLLINKRIANGVDLSHAYMFATGAILTASLIHIIPESFERFEDAELGLHDLGIHTGVTVLAGITASIIIRAVCTASQSHTGAPATAKVVEADGSQSRGPTTPTIPENLWELVKQRKGRALFDFKGLKPICWNVIVGDAVSGLGGFTRVTLVLTTKYKHVSSSVGAPPTKVSHSVSADLCARNTRCTALPVASRSGRRSSAAAQPWAGLLRRRR